MTGGSLPTKTMPEYIFREKVLTKIRKVVKEAKSVQLFLDYDGTLTSFTDNPKQAYPSKKTVHILESLTSIPGIQVAIISGRQLLELRKLLNLKGVTYAGTHGLQIEYPWDEKFVWDKAADSRPILGQIKKKLSEAFKDLEGVFLEDKGFTLGLHYRGFSGDAEVLEDKFKELVEKHLDGLELLCGDKILEVRPKGWHKGKAVELIKKKFVKSDPDGGKVVPFYIGDDRTDEDAFRHLKEGVTILVLNGKAQTEATEAKYYCQDPAEVLGLLNKISKW